MISEQITFLKATVNGLSVKLISMDAQVDNATAAHALGEVLGRWVGEVTTETYVLALDAGVEVAREMASGTRPCPCCIAMELDGYLHKKVL